MKPPAAPASARRPRERQLRERRGPPPRVGKRGGRPRRLFWLAAGPPLLLLAVAVALLAARNSAPAVPPPATDISAADRQASPELVREADAVGFRPTTEPGVGTIETQPASAAQPPPRRRTWLSSPARSTQAGTPSSPSTRTARTPPASSPTTATSVFPFPRCSTRARRPEASGGREVPAGSRSVTACGPTRPST